MSLHDNKYMDKHKENTKISTMYLTSFLYLLVVNMKYEKKTNTNFISASILYEQEQIIR